MAEAGASSQQKVAQQQVVRRFRQILLWPLEMLPVDEEAQIQRHWELLDQPSADNAWREVMDEFTQDSSQFGERHYNEFITFLPFVRRFLYGGGLSDESTATRISSPMHVYRREDVASVRITLRPGETPITLSVAHIDLYFFYDIDVVLLNVEVHGQDLLYRFGRAYPASWEEDGHGTHCPHLVEWLAADGKVLAVSDYEKKQKYLSFVCEHRAACIALNGYRHD